MLRRIASLNLYGIACLIAIAAWPFAFDRADAAAFDSAYNSGIEAFDKGQYDQALQFLLEAQSLGMDEPSLHYNLGATYYKLGRYAQARRSFLATARDPELAPLAYYNLGLCSIRLGDTGAARDWFDRVLHSTDNPRLRQLANEELSGTPTAAPEAVRPGSAYLSAALGYDSNVLLLSDSDVLSTSKRDDFFLELFGYGSRRVAGNPRTIALDVDAAASLLKYEHLSDYDIADLRLGGSVIREDVWRGEAGAHLDYSYVGGEGLTREKLLDLTASRDLSAASRLRLTYEYGAIDAIDANYRYLDGHRHRVAAKTTFRRSGTRLHLMYEFEFNDRRDLDAPLFASYSPIRNGVRILGEIPLAGRLGLEAEARYLHSRYRDSNEIAAGVFERRSDDRLSAGLRLVYTPRKFADLSLEYLYADNRSNIGRYEYLENIITLGVAQSF